MMTIIELLIFTIIFMQVWNACDAFGCCPIMVPCVPIKCRPCIPFPCPPPPPPPLTYSPPPPPCPPPPICPQPPPPVICPPLPPPCPPPVICPPPPPPIICPPLPPCPPPPICPRPIICPPTLPPLPPPTPPPYQTPHPIPIYPVPAPRATYTTPAINDCCCTCVIPCTPSQMRVHGAKIFSTSLVTDVEYDSKCNNPVLKSIMEENIMDDITISKRDIQRVAEEKLFKKFNVICSENDFAYIAYTDTFCQHSKNDISCYAFSPLPEF
ncbi:unnamed protein product [Cercopithifilaria johnstoni]|uniref:Ground-like domain-containing protein n=1 Tax=Cercopithifilaria johnstoni TaxID=2874296 RepID=A0A8J2LZR7_9BILA|nr:unnamed protein product [Cercopithifilaria johnstoni]